MRLGPKAIRQKTAIRKQMVELTRTNLKKGDILIQIGSLSRPEDLGVLLGQAVASHIWRGSMNARHALIVADRRDAIDATASGISYSSLDRLARSCHYVVYRCGDSVLRKAAAAQAISMIGGDYAVGKALASPVRFKNWNNSKYLRNTAKDNRMFCSEFVAAAYELAAKQTHRRALRINPRALSVKALDAMLSRSSQFTTLGYFVTDANGRTPTSGPWNVNPLHV